MGSALIKGYNIQCSNMVMWLSLILLWQLLWGLPKLPKGNQKLKHSMLLTNGRRGVWDLPQLNSGANCLFWIIKYLSAVIITIIFYHVLSMGWNGANYSTQVTIFHGDGSIILSSAGIETGQGINTKVREFCHIQKIHVYIHIYS